MHRRGSHGRGRSRRSARSRWIDDQGNWHVAARVERFTEPVLLLILQDAPAHGYELAERLGAWLPSERIDLGNLYRLLRAMEHEGLVESEWRHDLPGRTKRTYALAPEGTRLLDAWATSLRETELVLSSFSELYRERNET
jgi:DNA-binding PadR family transcriptional regulator